MKQKMIYFTIFFTVGLELFSLFDRFDPKIIIKLQLFFLIWYFTLLLVYRKKILKDNYDFNNIEKKYQYIFLFINFFSLFIQELIENFSIWVNTNQLKKNIYLRSFDTRFLFYFYFAYSLCMFIVLIKFKKFKILNVVILLLRIFILINLYLFSTN